MSIFHVFLVYLRAYLAHLISALLSALASFFFNAPATTEIYTLSLHDALPISRSAIVGERVKPQTSLRMVAPAATPASRSEEHTSELQSRVDLVCRLLLEKKKKRVTNIDKQYNHDQEG